MERLLAAGKDVLLDIDWQGARRIKQRIPCTQGIFILPPSLVALAQRLRERKQDSEATIARRMRDAVAELSHYSEFDHLVVNDDFSAALADLDAIATGRPETVRPLSVEPRALLLR